MNKPNIAMASDPATEKDTMPAAMAPSVTESSRYEGDTRPVTANAAVTAPAPNAPTRTPVNVSGRPRISVEKAGVSVVTGSEASPTIPTTTNGRSNAGSAITIRTLVRRRGGTLGAVRPSGRGVTSIIPIASARYDIEFRANAVEIPKRAMTATPKSGPRTRDRLKVTAVRATAAGSSERSTRAGTIAWSAGVARAVVTPRASATPITTTVEAAPAAVTRASTPARAAAATCITMTKRRRSKRSAALPATGARNMTAANCEKFTTPTRNEDPVSR